MAEMARLFPTQDACPSYYAITSMGGKKGMGNLMEKRRALLEKWIGFFGAPGIILADKNARFAGRVGGVVVAGVRFSATCATSL